MGGRGWILVAAMLTACGGQEPCGDSGCGDFLKIGLVPTGATGTYTVSLDADDDAFDTTCTVALPDDPTLQCDNEEVRPRGPLKLELVGTPATVEVVISKEGTEVHRKTLTPRYESAGRCRSCPQARVEVAFQG